MHIYRRVYGLGRSQLSTRIDAALMPAQLQGGVETIFSSPGFRVCPGVRGAGGLLVFLFVERVNNTKDI